MICTFIGGPSDGERLEVGDADEYFFVPSARKDKPGQSYKRVTLKEHGGNEFVYAMPKLTKTEVVKALVFNYVPGFRKGE